MMSGRASRLRRRWGILTPPSVLIVLATARAPGAEEGRGAHGPTPMAHEAQLFGHEDGTRGTAGDEFGNSISISGDTVIVGARSDAIPGGASNAGSAYVFYRSGTTWTEQAKLTVADSVSFGWSVSIDGDTAVVGENARGLAHVFVRSGNTWTLQQTLGPSVVPDDMFGWSVAISGDTILVGAPYSANLTGAAYVYVRSGTTWTEQQQLLARDGENGDRFGHAVSIDGDTALVGAWTDNTAGGTFAGSAYVFVRSGVAWSQQQKLVAPDPPSSFDLFSTQLSLSGDTAAIGAPMDDLGGEPGVDAGSVYVFQRSGTSWSLQQKLTASDAANSDSFGASVSIVADVLVVGASFDDTAGGTDAGSAYVFVRSGSVWLEAQKLLAPDGAANDLFGISAAFYGDTAVVGARADDTAGGADSGSAHVFHGSVPVELQAFTVH